jgi:hypothetical protein
LFVVNVVVVIIMFAIAVIIVVAFIKQAIFDSAFQQWALLMGEKG